LFKYLEANKKLFVYTPLVIYWIVLLIATSLPTNALPTLGVSDKFMHLGAFFGLGVLLNLTLIFQNRYIKLKLRNGFYTVFTGSLYAVFDEVHQYFIPGRFFDLLDLAGDLIGLILAVAFVILLKRINNFVPGETNI